MPDQLSAEMAAETLDAGYARLREAFLTQYPGFVGFAGDQRLYARERRYKDTLVQMFRERVQPLIDSRNSDGLWHELMQMLTLPLPYETKPAPQNLVGWRFVDSVRQLGESARAELGQEVVLLLDETSDFESRVRRFNAWIGQPGLGFASAASRSITSFLLSLWRPAEFMPVKSSAMGRAMRELKPGFKWSKGPITPEEWGTLRAAAREVAQRLTKDGWPPRDLIDVQSFLWVATEYRDGAGLEDESETGEEASDMQPARSDQRIPLNQILYGPPGTGKTYTTVTKALEILDPAVLTRGYANKDEARRAHKARYNELADAGLIGFVTFHQSFSYEDFVEGLRADADQETGQIRYEIKEGVFKSLCASAPARVVKREQADFDLDLSARRIWKMSLGNIHGPSASIFDECIEKGIALLGYGVNVDFNGCKSKAAVASRLAAADLSPEHSTEGYVVTAVWTFIHLMQRGDLIVVSDGLSRFRAIGVVSGEPDRLEDDREEYFQYRPVKWLRVYEPSLSHEQLMHVQFSQRTLYELKPGAIDLGKLGALLAPEDQLSEGQVAVGDEGPRPRVLIIDEINRGNISRIFGELITLIEPSKRLGAPEALEVTLPYSKQRFGVPDNVYIIGTMNTADRSIAGLDLALRRRFHFVEMQPDYSELEGVSVDGIAIAPMLRRMNERIEVLLDRDHAIGHSYFLPLRDDPSVLTLAGIFEHQVVPLLQEYFFEDWERIRWVLNDHSKSDAADMFVVGPASNVADLFGGMVDVPDRGRWRLQRSAFRALEAYRGI